VVFSYGPKVSLKRSFSDLESRTLAYEISLGLNGSNDVFNRSPTAAIVWKEAPNTLYVYHSTDVEVPVKWARVDGEMNNLKVYGISAEGKKYVLVTDFDDFGGLKYEVQGQGPSRTKELVGDFQFEDIGDVILVRHSGETVVREMRLPICDYTFNFDPVLKINVDIPSPKPECSAMPDSGYGDFYSPEVD